MKRFLSLALIFYSLSQTVSAQSVTFFEKFTIFQEVDVKDCSRDWKTPDDEICNLGGKGKSRNFLIPIYLAPTWMATRSDSAGFSGFFKEDALVGLLIETRGASSESDAYDALVKKFGKPSIKTIKKYKTISGISFDSIDAIWKIGPTKIIFYGTTGRINSGSIEVQTDQSLEIKKEIFPKRLEP